VLRIEGLGKLGFEPQVSALQRSMLDHYTTLVSLLITAMVFFMWKHHGNALHEASSALFHSTMSTAKAYSTWSDAETDALLEWLSVPNNYSSYCNGTKTKAYAAIAEALKTKTACQVENKLKNMTRDYKKATDWRSATGRGVEEAGGTIEAELNRRCSRFAELDAIFGTRPNVNPPSTIEPPGTWRRARGCSCSA
jgi:hypothetical protein